MTEQLWRGQIPFWDRSHEEKDHEEGPEAFCDSSKQTYRGSYLQEQWQISMGTIRNFMKRGIWKGEPMRRDFSLRKEDMLRYVREQHVGDPKLVLTDRLERLYPVDQLVSYWKATFLASWPIYPFSMRRVLLRMAHNKELIGHYRIGDAYRFSRTDWLHAARHLAKEDGYLMNKGRPMTDLDLMMAPYWRLLHEREGLSLQKVHLRNQKRDAGFSMASFEKGRLIAAILERQEAFEQDFLLLEKNLFDAE